MKRDEKVKQVELRFWLCRIVENRADADTNFHSVTVLKSVMLEFIKTMERKNYRVVIYGETNKGG